MDDDAAAKMILTLPQQGVLVSRGWTLSSEI